MSGWLEAFAAHPAIGSTNPSTSQLSPSILKLFITNNS